MIRQRLIARVWSATAGGKASYQCHRPLPSSSSSFLLRLNPNSASFSSSTGPSKPQSTQPAVKKSNSGHAQQSAESANPSPSSSSSSSSSTSNGPSSDSSNNNTDNSSSSPFANINKLSERDLGFLLDSLPMFRHTSVAPPQPTFRNSSTSCTGVLVPDGNSFFGNLLSTLNFRFRMAVYLSKYVAVSIDPGLFTLPENNEILVGSREAFLFMTDLFNTFHLESSRKQLRQLMTPQVFNALQASWKMLDAVGLRFLYKVRVNATLIRDFRLHDSDYFESGGGGGGLAVRVAPDVPPGMNPPPSSGPGNSATAPPTSRSPSAIPRTFKFSASQEPDSTSSAAVKDKPKTDTAVRYADLDIQYSVTEIFEIWTTRPNQFPQPAANPTATTEETAKPAESTDSTSTPATAEADTSTTKPTATPTASASASPASSPSSSSSTTSPTGPPSADELPPLKLLVSITGEADRGLRFYTNLPRPVEPGEGFYWIIDPENMSKQAESQIHKDIKKAPKANWIIKDIVD